jgi:hypothetical protein
MEFIEVKIVDALFSTYEYVLISCVWMDPACSAMDTERTTIEHLKNNVISATTLHIIKREDRLVC